MWTKQTTYTHIIQSVVNQVNRVNQVSLPEGEPCQSSEPTQTEASNPLESLEPASEVN